MADGLAQALPPEALTVIVNTGDDFEHLGLYICPDVDTVCYTLAGLANPQTGWGRAAETWEALDALGQLGGPTWFRLGDLDLGLHLERTRRLRLGHPLSRVTQDFCQALGVQQRVIPMSDDPIPTCVQTDQGDLPFQEYFVQQKCQPRVCGFRFEGVERARPAAGVLESLRECDLVLICPSNPWVSVDPILAVPGIRETVGGRPVLAISPIIGGQTVKGPAAKMYAEMGFQPSALTVAQHYAGLLAGFVLDRVDEDQASAVNDLEVRTLVTDTWMKSRQDRRRLAQEVIGFGSALVAELQ
jgi:LPPG:FO 2-phospho-L-lactate transferase